MTVATLSACAFCGGELPRAGAKYCSPKCRKDARKYQTQGQSSVRYQTASGEQNRPSQAIESIEATGREIVPEINRALRFEGVNDVTWKLTDGVMVRTPASRGQFGGFESTRALAWIMDIGWAAGRSSWGWVVRYGDWSSAPTTIGRAKATALALAKSDFSGKPVERVSPKGGIVRLHSMQTELVDEVADGRRVGHDGRRINSRFFEAEDAEVAP